MKITSSSKKYQINPNIMTCFDMEGNKKHGSNRPVKAAEPKKKTYLYLCNDWQKLESNYVTTT